MSNNWRTTSKIMICLGNGFMPPFKIIMALFSNTEGCLYYFQGGKNIKLFSCIIISM